MKKYITAISILFLLTNCNESPQVVSWQEFKVNKKGRFIVVEEYDSLQHIKNIKYFNSDSVTADGPEFLYRPNGQLSKWIWFSPISKYPAVGVYYGDDGNFDSLKGFPIIGYAKTPEGKFAIQTVNPPKVSYALGFKDYFKNTVINKKAYYPFITDTTSWFTLDELSFEKGHKYNVYFYITDTLNGKNKILDSVEKELKLEYWN